MSQFSYVIFKATRDSVKLRLFTFVLLSSCVFTVSLAFFVLSINKPSMGIVLSINEKGWAVESVDPIGLAIKTGIKVGYLPVEVNGQPADTSLEKYKNARTVLGTLINEATFVDDSGALKSVVLMNSSPTSESYVELATWFFVCFIFWIAGFYVFLKRPRNIAAALLFCCSLSFGLALSANVAGERAIPSSAQLAVVGSVIGPWLLLHFFLVLPEERAWLRDNSKLYFIYLPAAITLVLFPLIGWADGQPVQWFRTFRLLEYGMGFLAAVCVVVYNYFRATSPKTRQQMKVVLISCLAALVPFLVLSILPEAISRQTIIPANFGILFIAFIPVGMGYAVVTQRLMDIDFVIRRGVIYGLVTVVMAAVLSAAIFPILTFGQSIGVAEGIFIAVALAGVATALFGPTKKGIETLVDRFLYKDRYDYRYIIQSLSFSLNSLKELNAISRLVVGTAVHTLNLAGGCLFVTVQANPYVSTLNYKATAAQGTFAGQDRQNRLLALIYERNERIEFPNSAVSADPDLAFLIPLKAAEREIGFLCLSPKLSGQAFSRDDVYLIQGLVSVASVALHSAMLVHDVSIRDNFVSIASHELRTPMTGILAPADILLNHNLSKAERTRWLRTIIQNATTVDDMANELLDASRIHSGQIAMKLEGVKLADVFSERLRIYRETTNRHDFVIELEPELPEALIDRDKFGQVVGNLLSNAIKYSPGGGCITLSARRDPGRQRVIVSVADHGIGIGPEDRNSLFTTFHRIRRPETNDVRGIGLGLYIVKEWTEVMGGEVWLESELNKGSTFFVAVPMKDSNKPA